MSARRRRYEGRYSYVYSEFWRDPNVNTLSRDARHLLLCLMTGSLANQAGLFAINVEAILTDFSTTRDPISRAELEKLLGELEKRPDPRFPFIVRDADCVYIPMTWRVNPSKRSPKSISGAQWEVFRLPRRSKVVRRFLKDNPDVRAYTPYQDPSQGPVQGPVQGPDMLKRTKKEKEKNLKNLKNLKNQNEDDTDSDKAAHEQAAREIAHALAMPTTNSEVASATRTRSGNNGYLPADLVAKLHVAHPEKTPAQIIALFRPPEATA